MGASANQLPPVKKKRRRKKKRPENDPSNADSMVSGMTNSTTNGSPRKGKVVSKWGRRLDGHLVRMGQQRDDNHQKDASNLILFNNDSNERFSFQK